MGGYYVAVRTDRGPQSPSMTVKHNETVEAGWYYIRHGSHILYGVCSRLYKPSAACSMSCLTYMYYSHGIDLKPQNTQTLKITISLQKYDQGRIEPPKAARRHATSNSAYTDGIVLSVTKNRNPLRM